ncbi:MAG: hypothetical protein C7B46_18265 [Sulfobacillus benefaciens]|uniref:Phosphatidylinositol kinase n=1 Tax=Sulfobacillus benefaciens TaxID=453960 RepID=A0A2T2X6N2_9FIRM|nr:MAG: hypothetical protein C7B46_18265 [Sulfobacillus benefaciens]
MVHTIKIPVREASAFVRRAGSGGSHPLLLQLDNGVVALVKFQHNPQTTRSLASDLIGTLLGHLAGVPVPDVVLVHIPYHHAPRVPYLSQYRWRAGLQFGTVFLDQAQPLSRARIASLSNISDLTAGALLETWLYNQDVKFSHVMQLPHGETYQFFLTDHGYLFPNGPWWQVDDLRYHRDDFPIAKPLSIIAMESPAWFDFTAATERICSIQPKVLWEVLDTVPKEWSLSTRRKKAIFDFLTYRQQKLPVVAHRLQHLWNRGKSQGTRTGQVR